MTSSRCDRWRGRACSLALVLVLAGCSKHDKPLITQPPAVPMPHPATPVKAVLALQWSWVHLDDKRLSTLLTDDYAFSCAATDEAGNAFRGHGLTRYDEIESARHLFVGGGSSPPANSISLQLDQNLISQPDSRPGKQDTTYFQEIITSVVLRIKTDAEEYQVTGAARFFLVRGDSALIPAELAAGGTLPDSTRWYIDRWEDETVGSGIATAAVREGSRASALRALPARQSTWCELKGLYR